MDIISKDEFYNTCDNVNTKIIKYGHVNQPKVYEKDGNTIIKLFYPKKRAFSSDRIRPRGLRFYNNVQSLNSYGYDVPTITKLQFCPELKMYLVHYEKIQGHDVRSLAKQGDMKVIYKVIELLANLHNNGIFFRSIHLENLLSKPDGRIALIDIADVRFKSKPLAMYFRFRNIKHLLRVPHDRDLWQTFGVKNFFKVYFKLAPLPKFSQVLLYHLVSRSTKFELLEEPQLDSI